MWNISFTSKAKKEFSKLDRQTQKLIVKYLEQVVESGDPYNFGAALVGNMSGFWRYRVGKYRIICEIQDKNFTVELISVGKREKIYLL